MKKKLFASLLSLCLLISLFPVSAFAEEPVTDDAPEVTGDVIPGEGLGGSSGETGGSSGIDTPETSSNTAMEVGSGVTPGTESIPVPDEDGSTDPLAGPAGIPQAQAVDGTLDLSQGSIVITSNGYRQGDGTEIPYSGSYTITQTNSATATQNTITVESGTLNITLSGVNIDVSTAHNDGDIPCALAIKGGDVTLNLADSTENTLKSGYAPVDGFDVSFAGIWAQQGATLTIDGNGKLEAVAGSTRYGDETATGIGNRGKGAGIGACGYSKADTYATVGDIIIRGGEITATGSSASGYGGPGIGGGNNASKITITGGTVTAKCGGNQTGAAGIGGVYGYGGKKTIAISSNADVTATGGAAGIGGGAYQGAGTIQISGNATVTATGKAGAGIGGGGGPYTNDSAAGGAITISGGTITATGGDYCAGIGGGGTTQQPNGTYASGGGASGNITISGGVIKATGGKQAPGIGSGTLVNDLGKTASSNGLLETIIISGGSVEAVNGEDFTGTSYKVLDTDGNPTVDSGIGQGANPSDSAATAFATWTPQTGTGEAIIALKAVSGVSSYTRNNETVNIDRPDSGNAHLWLPEGYYSFDGGSTYELIATAEAKTAAGDLITKLNNITAGADTLNDIIACESTYNNFSTSLRCYVDATVTNGHTVAQLKEALKDQNVTVTVTLDPNKGTIENPRATATFGSSAELGVPTRANFVFTGWYLENANGQSERISDADGKVASWPYISDTTLTAHWKSEVEGSGTASSPYLLVSTANMIALSHISLGIGTDEEFEVFNLTNTSANVTALLNANYKLTKDVTLRTSDGFYGIGAVIYNADARTNGYNYFQGVFDGGSDNGVTITLDINNCSFVDNQGDPDDTYSSHGKVAITKQKYIELTGGIFSNTVNSTIKNIKTAGSVTLATRAGCVGVIVGTLNNGTIENCENGADLTTGTTHNVSFAGGIIGTATGSTTPITVKNCKNTGNITAGAALTIKGGVTTTSQGNSAAAGICAQTTATTATFEGCENTGNIHATRQTNFAERSSQAAGICSFASSGSATFKNCTNSGDVTADSFSSNRAGGIVVNAAGVKSMESCANSGKVTAKGGSAGAIFSNSATTGIVEDGILRDCYHVMTATSANSGWKLSDDTASVSGTKLKIPVTGEADNYFNASRYVVDGSGTKAADLYSADGSVLYTELTNNGNLLDTAYPFQSESDAYVIANAQSYINLVKAIQGDSTAQAAVLGNRLSGITDTSARAVALATAYVKVTGDFTLADVGSIGLGTSAIPFSGTIDGGGHTVTYVVSVDALEKTQNNYIGFVGHSVGAIVKGLNFAGSITVATTTDNDNGLYIGSAVAAGSTAVVDNCNAAVNITATQNSTVNNATMGIVRAGGLVGQQTSGTVRASSYDGDITVTAPKMPFAGGIAGECSGDVTGVTVTGNMTATLKYQAGIAVYGEDAYAGGIAGRMSGTISNSTVAGIISASNDCSLNNRYAYAGGLAGSSSNGLTVTDSTALTSVKAVVSNQAAEKTGGIAGSGSVTVSGTNWSIKTATVDEVTGVNAIDTTVLVDGIFGDSKSLYSGALPSGISLLSDIAELDASAGTVTYTKAGTNTISLVYDGKVFYTSDSITVSPKTLNSTDVTITGVNNTYPSDDEAAKDQANIEVVYQGTLLAAGADYTVTQDADNNKFTITFAGNYTGSVDASYTVTDTALEVHAKGYTGTYDGNSHGITVNAPDGATVSYGTDGSSYDLSEDAAKQTNVGTYVVYFKVTKDSKEVTGSEAIVIAKATPTGTPSYIKITASGKTLAEASLNSGTIRPAGGTITWDLPDSTAVQANTSYTWTYTPAASDTGNYKTLTGSIVLWTQGTGGNTNPGGSTGSSGGSSGGSILTYPVTTPSNLKNGTVTTSPKNAGKGATVTITVKPNSGYELDTLTVTDKNGKSIKVTEGKNGKYTFTMPASKVTVDASFTAIKETPAHSFTDIPDGYWAEGEIYWAYENGYMNGNTATTFNPNGAVTRQQLWMILARMSCQRPADFAEAKAWAVQSGISDGTNPGVALPRQQLVTILYRYAALQGYKVSGTADLTQFSDHASVAVYAKDAMSWSVANSIVGGTAQGTLNPTDTTSRAQFAVILYRFFENIVK